MCRSAQSVTLTLRCTNNMIQSKIVIFDWGKGVHSRALSRAAL